MVVRGFSFAAGCRSPISAPTQKCLPCPRSTIDAHRRIGAELRDLLQQRIEHAPDCSVALLRPVERERGDAALVDGRAEPRNRRRRAAHGDAPALERELGEAPGMAELAAIASRQRDRTLVVEADVMLLGITDGAMHLQRAAHDLERRARRPRLRRRHHRRMMLARVIGREHAIDERAVELDVDEAVDRAVLQHLEAADRLAELLAQLDVVERDIERCGRQADKLDRGAEHQEFLHARSQLSRLGPGRDHVLGRDVELVRR